MFECMEIAEAIYKGGAPSKNTQRAEADRASFGRKKKGRASTLPYNPEQGRSGKRKGRNAGHLSDEPTGAKKTCLLHGPGHSSEECKFLQEYTEKRSAQHTYKDKQVSSGGNKHGKTVEFASAAEEVNIMRSYDEPIPKKEEGKKAELKTQE